MKSTIYKNGVQSKVLNKKIRLIDLKDETFMIEILRHIGKEEELQGDEDHFLVKKVFRNKVLYGGVRLSKETLEILHSQIGYILYHK